MIVCGHAQPQSEHSLVEVIEQHRQQTLGVLACCLCICSPLLYYVGIITVAGSCSHDGDDVSVGRRQ